VSTLNLSDEHRYDSIGTLDIETSGFDGATEDLIAIGVGYCEANGENVAVEVFTQKDFDGDEAELIQSAYEWLNTRSPDGLATFKGSEFDFEFLEDKQQALGFTADDLMCQSNHVDLFIPRKEQAEAQNKKWPSLEESLDAYDIPEYTTMWGGVKLDNVRFGEELAPKYVTALDGRGQHSLDSLEAVVREYTETDIEANLALYEHDVGRKYTPTYAR